MGTADPDVGLCRYHHKKILFRQAVVDMCRSKRAWKVDSKEWDRHLRPRHNPV